MALVICMLNNIFMFAPSLTHQIVKIVTDVVILPYKGKCKTITQTRQCATLNVIM
jgi:hypothetical protein